LSTRIVATGAVIELDPNDIRTIAFDWDADLRDDVAIATSTFTITAVEQSVEAAALTKDNPAILTAAQASIALERTVEDDSRATRVRLDATTATLGDVYELDNKIVTDESPVQTKDKSVTVVIRKQ
jgi:hypothetical protein